MIKWPKPTIAKRSTNHPLIPDVQDELVETVDELAVGILRGVVHHKHSAAGKDTFNPIIHLYINIMSHSLCTA
jgi:hypothetical protein